MGESVYYVTNRGDRVRGPFDTQEEAKSVALDMNTNEVHTYYGVRQVRVEDEDA